MKALVALMVAACLTLAGCAGERMQRDGLALMEAGRYEEGLAKLAEAAKADPDNFAYRAALVRHREQTVARLLGAAAAERTAERPEAAQALYERILRIDPDNGRAREGLAQLSLDKRHEAALEEARKLLKKGDTEGARNALRPVLLQDPKHGKGLLLQRQIEEQAAKDQLAEPSLKAKFKKPVSLQFRDASLKMVFEALSRTSGINVLLDRDVKPELKASIFVQDVSVEDAIDLLLLQNQLEKKVLSDNTVFIYPNTPAKLKEYQDLKIRSFHLTNADPKQVLNMIKTLLKTKDIFIHEKTNSIVMRDTPDAIRLAEKLVADQDIAEPEVMLEVEVLEVSRTRLTELGIKWPDALSLTSPGAASGTAAAPLTFGQLKDTGINEYLTTPLTLGLNLKLEDAETNLLASPRIRARNREKAKILIGDRVPVITNAITPVATGAPVVTGNVQYLDVGLKLEVEPDIHLDNEVAIKVNLEVSSIIKEVVNDVSGTLAYQVGTRNASTVLRLKDGETQILAGLINDDDRKNASKVPGLGQLPVLGRLFSSHKDDNRKTEIVLSITPRVVGGARPAEAREVEYWAGTEASLRASPLLLRPLGKVDMSATGAAAPVAAGAARARPAPKPGAPAGGSPVMLSWQGPAQAKPGERISLTLNAQSVQAVGSLGLLVSYDPSVLSAVDAVEGDFLKRNGGQSSFNKSIDQASGQVLVDLAAPGGATGSGAAVTLVFEVVGAKAAVSQVAVSRVTPAGAGGEALASTVPEPHSIAVQ